MNDHYLRDIVLNFLIAGKDTTANTLSWLFYMLGKNPTVQDKIVFEIKESVEWAGIDNSTEDFTSRLNETAIDKMQYLHATISETLRLYPAVPVVQIRLLFSSLSHAKSRVRVHENKFNNHNWTYLIRHHWTTRRHAVLKSQICEITQARRSIQWLHFC
jgi:hypothetical protein